MARKGKLTRQLTFEDLRGLRAEGYVQDSTLDQRHGFGPEIQRHAIERFADSYGLVIGSRWYAEFLSGRSSKNRTQFQQFLEDGRLDSFDVLLVHHTSRFGRNQAECTRGKEELQELGKILVFVSQGIISGSDRDFLNERMNETMDEQYSRNISNYVSVGLEEKAEHGYAVGPPPLGYKSEIVPGRKGERKVPDAETMPILLMALGEYATNHFSFREVDRLNAHGFRTRTSRPFTGSSIRDVLGNRFYEGKVIYHQGQPDEVIIDGLHEVPLEVKDLWLRCREIKFKRRNTTSGHPRGLVRHYPFSRVLTCHHCGSPYYGEAVRKGDGFDLRLSHERRGSNGSCNCNPRSRSVQSPVDQMGERVLPYLTLDVGWKSRIVAALRAQQDTDAPDPGKEHRFQGALERLRKQHLWGDISDERYQTERRNLERQLTLVARPTQPPQLPNLDRAAQLLEDLPALWQHDGVTDQQREALIQEVFCRITINGKEFSSLQPNPPYVPLFATMLTDEKLGYRAVNSPPSRPGSIIRGVFAPDGVTGNWRVSHLHQRTFSLLIALRLSTNCSRDQSCSTTKCSQVCSERISHANSVSSSTASGPVPVNCGVPFKPEFSSKNAKKSSQDVNCELRQVAARSDLGQNELTGEYPQIV